MSLGSTLFLKAVILFIGAIVLAILTIALPIAINGELKGDYDYLPILIGLYVPAIPFLIALFQGFKLLRLIDANQVFSGLSITSLHTIKFSAAAISVLFSLGMPYIFYIADQDDAPGLVAIGLVIIFTSTVIATFAAVMQKLIQNAVDIKNENDLTV